MTASFWKGKRVFVTGHTGFKGSWLGAILKILGAEVSGYALKPAQDFKLFEVVRSAGGFGSVEADIRNIDLLIKEMQKRQPEVVFHLAAQPIVTEGYNNPVYTYEVNVMGTVNVLEAVRCCGSVRSFINVTTDKVYQNNEWVWGYRENDILDGYDPYANSKSCSELATNAYKRSFLCDVAVSICRAGNVIGGGDYGANRIIPDCVRAAMQNTEITIRNPGAIRPYQHVLDPLFAYLLVAHSQWEKPIAYQGTYNIGPDINDCVTTAKLADLFCEAWGGGLRWKHAVQDNAPHEANLLMLDCSKIKKNLKWHPVWRIDQAVNKTVQWWQEYLAGCSMFPVMEKQINEYLSEAAYEI